MYLVVNCVVCTIIMAQNPPARRHAILGEALTGNKITIWSGLIHKTFTIETPITPKVKLLAISLSLDACQTKLAQQLLKMVSEKPISIMSC